jgi:hypothetical protein
MTGVILVLLMGTAKTVVRPHCRLMSSAPLHSSKDKRTAAVPTCSLVAAQSLPAPGLLRCVPCVYMQA